MLVEEWHARLCNMGNLTDSNMLYWFQLIQQFKLWSLALQEEQNAFT